jgi:SdrD B-like domain/Kelch motif
MAKFRGARSGPVRSVRRTQLQVEVLEDRNLMTGAWSTLAHLAPAATGTMMLLSDGTVLAQGPNQSSAWYNLAPDLSGSYGNGTWSTLASMHFSRLYMASNVLTDGRVLVVGGEYSSAGSQTRTGEIYDPVANTWTNIANFSQGTFGDAPSAMLPDGSVLGAYQSGPQTYIYHPSTNTWTPTGSKQRNDQSSEETFVKLSDDSILTYDIWSTIQTGVGHAQRYVPSTGTWVDAGTPPNNLSSGAVGDEMGPAFLLPDGRAIFFGATGRTAYYDPATGSWAAGPDIRIGTGPLLGADDSPGAMLPNGKILLAVDTPLFHPPTKILEFDPSTDTYTDVTPPSSIINLTTTTSFAYTTRMLVMPSGDVLLTNGASRTLAVYTPDGAPDSSWLPTISSITDNGDGSFTLTGTQLNGLSEGACYGDDAEMSSNYPIVRITDSAANVLYARTYNWSSTGVATGSTSETTQFTLPSGIVGSYSVTVIANGIASNVFVQQISGVVFNDLNQTGTRDPGNPGLAGWIIFIDLYGDGMFHEDDPFTITDASGGYLFSGLDPGTYTVYEVVPSGWTQSMPGAGFFTVTILDSATTTFLQDFGNF